MGILPRFRTLCVCVQQWDILHLVLYSQVHSCLSYFIWLMQMSCLEQSDSVCQDSHYTVTEISVVPNQKEQWLILCQLWSLIREAFFQSSAGKESHLSDYFWRTGLKKRIWVKIFWNMTSISNICTVLFVRRMLNVCERKCVCYTLWLPVSHSDIPSCFYLPVTHLVIPNIVPADVFSGAHFFPSPKSHFLPSKQRPILAFLYPSRIVGT